MSLTSPVTFGCLFHSITFLTLSVNLQRVYTAASATSVKHDLCRTSWNFLALLSDHNELFKREPHRLSLLRVWSRSPVRIFSIPFLRLEGNLRSSKHSRNARTAVIRENSLTLQMHELEENTREFGAASIPDVEHDTLDDSQKSFRDKHRTISSSRVSSILGELRRQRRHTLRL